MIFRTIESAVVGIGLKTDVCGRAQVCKYILHIFFLKFEFERNEEKISCL